MQKACFTSSLKLTIIDGFAGGGIYKGDITGSPIRIKRAVESSKEIIKFEKEQSKCMPVDFNIDYMFIEKKRDSFSFLKKTLTDFGYECAKIKCILGEFSLQLDKIIQHIKEKSRSQRAIFILDQYGYADAPIKDINKIFTNLKKAEVILTFSMDSLIDYLTRDNPATLLNLGLEKEDIERIFDVKEDSDFSRAKLQPILYEGIVNASGADYFTPFFIKCDKSNSLIGYFIFRLIQQPEMK